MMNFRIIKASLIDILGAAEAGRYRTIGYQRQAQTAVENLNSARSVSVFYRAGAFAESAAAMSGPVQHGMTFNVNMIVATASKVDLTVINNPMSTPAQIEAALAAKLDAQNLADNSMDELIDIIYQELMDNENIDIGLDRGDVAKRWISNIDKDQPIENGEYVVLTGSMQFSASTNEQLAGDTGSQAGDVIDQTINFEDQGGNQDPGRAGVLTWSVGGP